MLWGLWQWAEQSDGFLPARGIEVTKKQQLVEHHLFYYTVAQGCPDTMEEGKVCGRDIKNKV